MLWIFIGFLFGALILHELAHAFFMMRNRVEMKTIAIGFPPLLVKKSVVFRKVQEKPIVFGIGLLPFGAYVQPTAKGEDHLSTLTLDDKILIYGAGVISHFVAILVFIFVLYVFGMTNPSLLGWMILGVVGGSTALFFLRPAIGGVVLMFIGFSAIGFVAWAFLVLGVDNTVVGPIGLGKLAQQSKSAIDLIKLALAVSISMGALNAAPLAPLDGGHMLSAYLERPLGKERALAIKRNVAFVGLAAIIALTVLAMWQDIKGIL